MTTTPPNAYRPAVYGLLNIIKYRHVPDPARAKKGLHLAQCWISRENAGLYSLIVPAMYGPLDFLQLVTARTVHEAETSGLVELGDPVPMPVYNYGGPKYRWRTIQQGQTIGLTERGMAVTR